MPFAEIVDALGVAARLRDCRVDEPRRLDGIALEVRASSAAPLDRKADERKVVTPLVLPDEHAADLAASRAPELIDQPVEQYSRDREAHLRCRAVC